MPKNKTHSGAKKVFKVTGTGKLRRLKVGRKSGAAFASAPTTGSRKKKGDFRKLWIQRINAAARANGMTYNRFIQGLGLAGIEVDRKILAELAVSDEKAFSGLVQVAKTAVAAAA